MCQFPDSETSSANAEYEQKIKALESQLKEILQEKIKVDDELAREKTMNNDLKARIKLKDVHIKRLEGILEDQDAMKKENSRLKQQLRASDFYSYVCKISSTANETEIEDIIGMYSTKNGDPSCGEFLKLIRKQLRAMEQKNKELLEQIRKERLENSKKDKEIEKLREELLSQSRKRTKVPSTSKESPMATRQRTARPSFGFSFYEEDSEIQPEPNPEKSQDPAFSQSITSLPTNTRIRIFLIPKINLKLISDGSPSSPMRVHKFTGPKFSSSNSSCQILEEIKGQCKQYMSIFDESDDLENIPPPPRPPKKTIPKNPIQLGNDLISPNLLAHASKSNLMNFND
ncbi:unnamed protein product [Meloidogyne enterolobii]|uniref:Uncharacterized protein n=1 Tax=Meloidogyne enterolobii TaxID=390850 RepID=A0ACB0ZNK0_MELEN